MQAGGEDVTRGSVRLIVDGRPAGDPVRLGDSGEAVLAAGNLAEGTHDIEAIYGGADGYIGSKVEVTRQVANATVVEGRSFCNTGPVALSGAEGPRYPSTVDVSRLKGLVSRVRVRLRGLSLSAPVDLGMMLAAPHGGRNVVLLGGAGGDAAVQDLTVSLDDDAAAPVSSSSIRSGSFRPTINQTPLFGARAPHPSSTSQLSQLDGIDPNGTWSLWAVDGSTAASGSLSGGWCVSVESLIPTRTTVVSKGEPIAGEPVTFTAAVTAAGEPVVDGSVRLRDADGAILGDSAEVGTDGSATFVVDSLAAGAHEIVAAYSGTREHAASNGEVFPIVRPVANAGGPYRIAVGDALVLDGSKCSPGAVYDWDLDGDGSFDDASGSSPSVSWADLQALGVRARPARYAVTVRVAAGTGTLEYAKTTLDVSAEPMPTPGPIRILSTASDNSAPVDAPVTVHLLPTGLSSAPGSTLTYTVDWGDGSPVQTVDGAGEAVVSHIFTRPGQHQVRYTVTDRRTGGQHQCPSRCRSGRGRRRCRRRTLLPQRPIPYLEADSVQPRSRRAHR